MNCCPDQIPPPNEKASNYVNILRLLMFVQLIVGVVKMVAFSPFAGIYDLISALIIYQGYAQLNYCNMIIIMFLNGLNLVQLVAIVGAIIQDGYPWLINTYFKAKYVAIISYLTLALYLAICVASFYAYREFKALSYEGVGGAQFLGGGAGALLPTTQQQQQPQTSAYGGYGGGDNENQGRSNNERAEQSRPANAGGFQAFSGRGVTIG